MNTLETKKSNSSEKATPSVNATFSHIRKVKPVRTLAYKPKTTGLSCIPLGGPI